jgi:hypothetical protein
MTLGLKKGIFDGGQVELIDVKIIRFNILSIGKRKTVFYKTATPVSGTWCRR